MHRGIARLQSPTLVSCLDRGVHYGPHIAVAPEEAGIKRFRKEVERAGYDHTDGMFRIKWTDEVLEVRGVLMWLS